jgi:hypothetical protein
MFFKITGWALLFWKPLLEIQTKTKTFYVRSSNPKMLKEDLQKKWLGDIDD